MEVYKGLVALRVGINGAARGCPQLLHQAAKGPADRAIWLALVLTWSSSQEVGHKLWNCHQALHDRVGKTGIAQVGQPYKTLQGGAVSKETGLAVSL